MAFATLATVAAALAAAPAGWSATPKKTAKSKSAVKKPAARQPSGPPPRDLAGMVKAYREAPTAARRSTVLNYAAAHPKEAALAKLGLGIAAWEQKDFGGVVASLSGLEAKLPQVADYVAYYRNAARLELQDGAAAAQDLAIPHTVALPSPLAGRTLVLRARALTPGRAEEAIRLLSETYSSLPQPEGDLALADAYRASNDNVRAAAFYQRVYYPWPGGDAAMRAGVALGELRASMGDAFPPPAPEMVLRRGDRLLELKDYPRAKAEFENVSAWLSGAAREFALVRAGAADLLRGQAHSALLYLRGLELTDPEADAERLYYVAESARRSNDETAMMDAVGQLSRRYAKSPWRARALLAAGNRFLLANRPDEYVPLYRAMYEDFPADLQAAQAHWKVAFAAHLTGQSDANNLLREQVLQYPVNAPASSALYFLGRRAEVQGDAGAARAYYARLVDVYPNQFYAVLGRERLADVAIGAATPSPSVQAFLNTVVSPPRNPPVMSPTAATAARIGRSRVLRQAGLADFADAELRFGGRTDGQPWLDAMEMAGAAENPFLALRAMKGYGGDYLNTPLESAPRKYWEYLFPLPWRTEMENNALARQLDPFVVAGLIRQESEFNPKAVSHAKAYGLTQIRPPTGRMYARQAGVGRVSTTSLMQPSTNLKLGTLILRSMHDHQGGKWERTLAAYNAGPGRVADWITRANFREPAEFIESIPFTETRDYVQAVLRNADIYRRLYGGRSQVMGVGE